MRKFTILLFSLALVFPGIVIGQKVKPAFDLTSKSMRFPHQYKKWGFQTSVGFSMVKPPFDLVENAIQAPLVNFHTTFGMPLGFSLEGDITTLVVSNQIALGPRWNFIYKNFSFNLGYDLAFLAGWMKFGGFNNTGTGWVHYPNASIGFKTRDVAFTLKGEVVILGQIMLKAGDNEVDRKKDYFNGGTLALYVEQRLWKDKVLTIGLKDNYVKLYWPCWFLFTTFDRYYHVPELYFSWVL